MEATFTGDLQHRLVADSGPCNVDGSQETRLDARSNLTTYVYDSTANLTSRRYPDGSRGTFSYNALEDRTMMANSTGRSTTTYDALKRRRTVTTPAGHILTYSYDSLTLAGWHVRVELLVIQQMLGAMLASRAMQAWHPQTCHPANRSAMIDPDGGRFTYAYDNMNRISHQVSPQGDRTTYSYDANGRRTVTKLANGTRASFTYDAASRLTRLANLKSDRTTISSFDYKYDKAGNRTSVLEADGSRVTYSYDPTYQLTGEHRTGTTPYRHTFVYDSTGNRTLKNEDGVRTTYAYDDANQLKYAETASGRTTYSFDADGNQELVVEPNGGRTTTSWDYENKATLVQLPTGIRNTMAYESDGLRMKLEDSSGTKKFVWDNQNYLAETDAGDATQAIYTLAPMQFGSLISQVRNSTTNWFHFGAQGSVREASNSNEGISDAFTYNAWGNEIARTGNTDTPMRYIGELGYYHDEATGVNYVRARYYDPDIARWLSQDPAAARNHSDILRMERFLGGIESNLVATATRLNTVLNSALVSDKSVRVLRARDLHSFKNQLLPDVRALHAELQYRGINSPDADHTLYTYGSNNPLRFVDPSGLGVVDCAKALAELAAVQVRALKRMNDNIKHWPPDVGHVKAKRQILTQLEAAYAKVIKFCACDLKDSAKKAIEDTIETIKEQLDQLIRAITDREFISALLAATAVVLALTLLAALIAEAILLLPVGI